MPAPSIRCAIHIFWMLVLGYAAPAAVCATSGNLDNHGSTSLGFPRGGVKVGNAIDPWLDPSGVDSTPDTALARHAPDRRNEIDALTRSTLANGANPATATFCYDAAGNLSCDGDYFYEYDAWNRLIEVSIAQPAQSPPPGVCGFAPGEAVKRYAYDGLGRLARTQSPFPDAGAGWGAARSVLYFYDGIRRIQEVTVDPTDTLEMAFAPGGGGGPSDEALIAEESLGQGAHTTKQDSAPSAYEKALIDESINANAPPEGGNQSQSGGGSTQPVPIALTREYIWGPADSFIGGGIDELLAQYDRDGVAW